MTIRIGDVTWVEGAFGRYERSEGGAGFMASMVRTVREKARCDAPTTARRHRAQDPLHEPDVVQTSVDAVDRHARGLPVFHDVEDTGPGDFAWVYGAAVKGPSSTP